LKLPQLRTANVHYFPSITHQRPFGLSSPLRSLVLIPAHRLQIRENATVMLHADAILKTVNTKPMQCLSPVGQRTSSHVDCCHLFEAACCRRHSLETSPTQWALCPSPWKTHPQPCGLPSPLQSLSLMSAHCLRIRENATVTLYADAIPKTKSTETMQCPSPRRTHQQPCGLLSPLRSRVLETFT